MTNRAHIACVLAAAALTACGPTVPEELDPMVELKPKTFESCGELEAFLDAQQRLPPHAVSHYASPDALGFEDVEGFESMTTDGDFVYVANGDRLSIFAERDQMARAVGAVVVGDEALGDRILGVHVDDFQAVLLVGMSQETAPLRDTVLPTRPADAAILRAMVFDVSDPRRPELERSIFIDGGLDRGWAVDGKISLVVDTGFHTPSATEGRGRNMPHSFPYLYDLNVKSGDAWVHQDDPAAYCGNAVTSNVAIPHDAKMFVTFDLGDEEPGLSSSLLLDDVRLAHATRDAAVLLGSNGRSQDTGREEGTYVYRYATDGEAARLANWTQVTGFYAGASPADERDGELRIGTDRSFWRLGVPDQPGPLTRDAVVWGLLPREVVMEWRFRGDHAIGLSYEEEKFSQEAHRYMVWRFDIRAKQKTSIGPDFPPEQLPVAFHLVDGDSLAYVTRETETETDDRGEEIPVNEIIRGRVVDLRTTPARREGAFQYETEPDGYPFAPPVRKFSESLYGISVPQLGQMTVYARTENGVLLPSQTVSHADAEGRPLAVYDTFLFGSTLWTLSNAAVALVDTETVGVTHYYDL